MKNRSPLPSLATALALLLAFTVASTLTTSAAPPPLELKDGDRVVLVGDTLIEREQTYGTIEAEITAAFPKKRIEFRNLGWSGDTPEGQSRVSFDWSKPREDWFRQLTNQIAAAKPTVILVGYGMASSFDGEAGVEEFRKSLTRLVDAMLKSHTPRIGLLGPIPHEQLGPPLPDPAAHNRQLQMYGKVVADVAAARGLPFLSLYDALQPAMKPRPEQPLTDNGIHLNQRGYRSLALILADWFGAPAPGWRFEKNVRKGGLERSQGIEVSDVQATSSSLKLRVRLNRLPSPADAPPGILKVDGLTKGDYQLVVDGKPALTATASEWIDGKAIELAEDTAQSGRLLSTIQKKNSLFFHRWRPQNQTYLFGFRKHEQGRNAHEVPEFDALVSEEETRIATLRQPTWRQLELVKLKNPAKPVQPSGLPVATAPAPQAALVPKSTPQPIPTFEIDPAFEIQLFAENPQLAKPIQMNFDPEGRLWIASSEMYPQIKPGQEASDKILVVEDTDGDGKADKSTVFADGLLIPTGVEPGDGGVYVGQSTELLHLKDTDGDGRADQRRVVLSGFGTEDTHHILHTLRWGHDGQLYMNQSIYIHTHTETPHGVTRLNSGGVLAYRPATAEFEVFLRGFCNPWGHHFDDFGQSMVTDGAGFQGLSFGIRGAMYFTYAGGRRILESISPGTYPKFCGLERVESTQFPPDFQNNWITCDFRAHRVVRFGVEESGSAFQSRELPDLLRTTNVTFRPIDVKFGPDGALYIADWSNPIIQHGEVDFRDPRRDHEHGRIWRVTAKNRPLVKTRPARSQSNKELLGHLASDNDWTQQSARRILAERGTAILPDVKTWAADQKSDELRLEALWLHQAVDSPEPGLLKTLLDSPDHRVRAAATRVLSFWQQRVPAGLDLLAARSKDTHGRVRIEAVRALSRVPSLRAVELVLNVLDTPMDSFLEYAVWLSINDMAGIWVDALNSGQWRADGRQNQLEYGLKAIEPAIASRALKQWLARNTIPADGQGPGIEFIGQAGGPADLATLFSRLAKGEFTPPASLRVLDSLIQAAQLRKLTPSGDLAPIFQLLNREQDDARARAIRLAGLWKPPGASAALLTQARKPGVTQPELEQIFQSLGEIGGTDVVQGLQQLLQGATAPAALRPAMLALARLSPDSAAPHAATLLGTTKTEEEATGLWRSLLGYKGVGAAIAKAAPKEGFPIHVRSAGLKTAREGNRKEPELVAALSVGQVATSEIELTDQQLKELAAKAAQSGDPHRGERIYRRAELACVSCHAIGGAGGKVGPDMTSIGASAPADYLVESLLYPNRKIKEGFHSIIIETDDDLEYSGVLSRETPDQVFIRDATNKEVSVPKARIKGRRNGASLMPSGLIDLLSLEERLDLIRFLSELGKPGEFDAAQGGAARLIHVRAATHDQEQFGEDKVIATPLEDKAWNPVFTLVNGRLSREDLAAATANFRYSGVLGVYTATRFQAGRAGTVRLKIQAPAGTPGWLNGKPITVGEETTAEAAAGQNRLVLKVDPRKVTEGIRISSGEVTFINQ